MKNLITYLKALWSSMGNSQKSDMRHDCRLTVGSPSGLESSTLLKFVSVLVLILTIGVGEMWGAYSATFIRISSISELSAGDSVLVVIQDAKTPTSGYAVQNNSTNYSSVTIATATNSITCTNAKCVWNVAKSNSNWQFVRGTQYIAWTSSTTVSATATGNTNTWTIADIKDYSGYLRIKNTGTGTRDLAWGSQFKAYANSNYVNQMATSPAVALKQYDGALSIYKKQTCTSLASINGSIKSCTATSATLKWDNLSNVDGTTPYAVSVSPSGPSVGSITTVDGKKNCTITGLTAGSSYTFTINAYGDASHCDASQNISFTAPKITASATITGLDYIETHGPSTAQSFTVSGVGLTGDITITAPSNFQVSKTSSTSGFANSVSLSPTSGTISSTPIYVRLVADLSTATYGPSNVTISGGSAAENTSVSVKGIVSPACDNPVIGTQPSGATYNMNASATALSVVATGASLTYQWYSNTTNNNTSGTIIDGATSSSYTPPTTATGTKYYYCIVYSGACSTTSNTAAITVSTPTIAIPSPSVYGFGDKAVDGSYTTTFTISGSNLAYNTGLTLSIEGTAAKSMYSIDKTSIAQTSTGTVASTTVTVTYHPTTAAVHGTGSEIYVLISSTGATNRSVLLTGTGKWQATFLDVDGNVHDTKLAANGSAPDKPASNPTTCDLTSTTFVGWTQTKWDGKLSQSEIDAKTTAATKVYTSAVALENMTGHKTYYPVFAKRSGSETENEMTINYTAIGSGYASTDIDFDDITFGRSNWGGQSTSTYYYVQGKTGNSMYNKDEFPGYIKSVYFNKYGGTGNFYIGTSQSPTTNETAIATGTTNYTSSNNYTYIKFFSTSTIQLTSIVITYVTSSYTYSEYLTTCCTSNDITLAGSGNISGAGTFSADAASACEGATITLSTSICSGYTVGDWDVYKTGESSTKVSVTDNAFTMPAYGVTVALSTTIRQDHYIDKLHNSAGYTGTGALREGCSYSVPDDISNTTPGSGCENEHYVFVGWVDAGHVAADGSLLSGYSLFKGGTKDASGTTYYAIWAKDIE